MSQKINLKCIKIRAFSIAEILVVLMIVGAITVASVSLHKSREEKAMGKLYIKAFNTLRLAAFGIQEEVMAYNEEIREEAIEAGLSKPAYGKQRIFPNVQENNKAEPSNLCAELVKKMNTAKEGCAIIDVNHTALPKDFKFPESPSFSTSDGMKYYVTTIGSSSYSSEKFFLVFVDINGNRRPNTVVYDPKKKMADIVPFLISKENGEVVPAGWPIYDKNYIQARVVSSDPELEREYSQLMTFYAARNRAYGYTFKLDPMSDKTYDQYFKNTSPYVSGVKFPPIPFSCSSSGYSTTTSFPPCKVEVNTNMK